MQRIAIVGASGRMGLNLIKAAHAAEITGKAKLTAAVSRPQSTSIGQDEGILANVGATGVTIVPTLDQVLDCFDVVIDFTRPEASLNHLAICQHAGKQIVIGTTGFTDSQKAQIVEMARDTAIVYAPNFSVGVNLLLKLLTITTQVVGEYSEIGRAHV